MVAISMIHNWSQSTDGSGVAVRIVLFDYKKAFDLIDHGILAEKISRLPIPKAVVRWTIDFLQDRKQRVKLTNDCVSEWGDAPAGVPQGTKLGPWLILLMINDLKITEVSTWKYVLMYYVFYILVNHTIQLYGCKVNFKYTIYLSSKMH